MRRILKSFLLLFTALTGGMALADDAKIVAPTPETPAYKVCFTFDPLAAPAVSRVFAVLTEPLEGPPSLVISQFRSDQSSRRCELELTAPVAVVNLKSPRAGGTKAVLMRVDRTTTVTTFYIEPLS